MKFIYWFAFYNLYSPSVRYRAKYPLDFFAKNKSVGNYFITPSYSPKGILLFLKAYISALFFRKNKSLIVIQRVQSNFIYATLLKILIKFRKSGTVYDLDDADYLTNNPKTIYYFAKKCEKISAGSRQIGNHLSQFNQQIIYTTSPIVDLNIVKIRRNSIFTIGWIGGFNWGHKDSLIEFVFPALKQLSFNYKLVLIGVQDINDIEFIKNYFITKSNLEIEIPVGIDWNNEKEIQNRIATFDIGIATLLDTPMHLSKSGIKAKQYMNNGVPVLSTNLPENNSVVFDGINGYYCSNINDFKERLSEFYTMSDEKYMQFSKNARDSICNFDQENYFKYFERIYNGI